MQNGLLILDISFSTSVESESELESGSEKSMDPNKKNYFGSATLAPVQLKK
jgi:hypothetical protein